MALSVNPTAQNTANSMLQHLVAYPHTLASSELTRIIDLMEWTPGQDIRELADMLFGNYPPTFPSPTHERDYNACGSFREKVAYLASLEFDPVNPGTPTQNEILTAVNKVVEYIRTNLIPSIAPNESKIIRAGVLANLQIDLTSEQRWHLSTALMGVTAHMTNNDMSEFAANMNLQHATTAQKLAKLQEVIDVLQSEGVYATLNPDIQTAINALDINALLKPLNTLDTAYRDLGSAFNSVRNAYRHFGRNAGPLSSGQITLLTETLTSLGIDITSYTLPDGTNSSQDINTAIASLRSKVVGDKDFLSACRQTGVAPAECSRLFASHVAMERLRLAKANLETTKNTTLGQYRRSCDDSISAWQNVLRNRVVEIGGSLGIGGGTPEQLAQLSDMLERNPTVFARTSLPDDGNITAALDYVLENKSPTLADPNQRVLRDNLSRYIRGQSNLVQTLTHSQDNPFVRQDSLPTQFFHILSQTERARKAVGKAVGPAVKGFSRLIESTSKRVVGTVTDIAIAGTGRIGAVGDWVANTTRPEVKGKWMLTRVLQRSVKYPFYWLTAGPAKTVGFLAGNAPKEIMSFTKNRVGKIYDGTIGIANDTFEGSNVRTVTDILATLIDRGTGVIGGVASEWANMAYQALSTAEKRRVFEELALVHDERGVANMLDATGINATLNTDLGLGINDTLGTNTYIGSIRNKPNAKNMNEKLRKDVFDYIIRELGIHTQTLTQERDNLPTEQLHQRRLITETIRHLQKFDTCLKMPFNKANHYSLIQAQITALVTVFWRGVWSLYEQINNRKWIIVGEIWNPPPWATGLRGQVETNRANLANLNRKDWVLQQEAVSKSEEKLAKKEAELEDVRSAMMWIEHISNHGNPSSLVRILEGIRVAHNNFDISWQHHVWGVALPIRWIGVIPPLTNTASVFSDSINNLILP